MKYVSFVDILGFKNIVKNRSHEDASNLITKFSKLVYDKWSEFKLDSNARIHGFIVSDCAIVYTDHCSPALLNDLIKLLVCIFNSAVFEEDIMLRATITKGNFDDLPSHSFENLSKKLIVGEAYVQATILESQFKGAKIVFGEDVNNDYGEVEGDRYQANLIKVNENEYYELKWFDENIFDDTGKLERFVIMASESKWLSHYYQTLQIGLSSVKNSERKKEILDKIWSLIAKNDTQFKQNRDRFITNSFSDEVDHNFRKTLAKYFREKIDESVDARNLALPV